MKKLLIYLCTLSFLTIIFCPTQIFATNVEVTFTGKIGCSGFPSGCTVIEDPFGMLAGKIAEGDNFEGYFILPATLPVNPPTSEYLVQATFSFPFFIEINGYTWRSNNHSFTIQDDDPFNDFDQYTSQVQALGQRVTTIGDSFTAGLQLFERHRSLPISTNPLNPPDPSTFGGSNRLQIWGSIDGMSSAAYLITGDIESLSAAPVPEPITVSIDIIPKTCPSETPIKGRAVEVVIHGTVDLDVNDIDIASVRLEGVAPTRSSLKDKSTPLVTPPTDCECTSDGKDGSIDLGLKFDKKAIITALGGVVDVDIEYHLTLSGVLNDETLIEGYDCIVFVKKGGKKD